MPPIVFKKNDVQVSLTMKGLDEAVVMGSLSRLEVTVA